MDDREVEVKEYDPEQQIKLAMELVKIIFTKIKQASSAVELSTPALLISLEVTKKMVLEECHPADRAKCQEICADVMKDMRIMVQKVGEKNEKPL